MFVIGVDEAGYGPNLGPLVVSATVWEIPDAVGEFDFYDRLQAGVAAELCEDGRVVIADSKQLFKPGGDWRRLERGIGAALRLLDLSPSGWRALWQRLDSESHRQCLSDPWHEGFDLPLPRDIAVDEIESAAHRWQAALAACGVRLVAIESRLIFPSEFNALLDRWEKKSNVLSHVTLSLVRRLLDPLDGPAIVWCDKHGGRDRYIPLLQHHFPDHWIAARKESRAESAYVWGEADQRIEWLFSEKGERRLPVALASMVSKYVRELAMAAWNDYWRRHLPELKPTAGYPVDAKRFMDAIRPTAERLGIAEQTVWRRL